MTNKEIAKKVTNLAFSQGDGTSDSESFALRMLIETLNNPMKYSNERVGYTKEHMESAILKLLDKRINGVDFMDLSEIIVEKELFRMKKNG